MQTYRVQGEYVLVALGDTYAGHNPSSHVAFGFAGMLRTTPKGVCNVKYSIFNGPWLTKTGLLSNKTCLYVQKAPKLGLFKLLILPYIVRF